MNILLLVWIHLVPALLHIASGCDFRLNVQHTHSNGTVSGIVQLKIGSLWHPLCSNISSRIDRDIVCLHSFHEDHPNNDIHHALVLTCNSSTQNICQCEAKADPSCRQYLHINCTSGSPSMSIPAGVASFLAISAILLVVIPCTIAVLVIRKKKLGRIVIENRDNDRISGNNEGMPPSQIILKETSFLNNNNFELFVEKKVEDDAVSGSSSLVPELPPRKYLAELEVTREMLPMAMDITIRPLDSIEASTAFDGSIPHFVLENTTDVVNASNFHHFVEDNAASDHHSSSCNSDDYEGVAPDLPQRCYMSELEPTDLPTSSPETNGEAEERNSSRSSTMSGNHTASMLQDVKDVSDITGELLESKYMPLEHKSSGAMRESFYMSLNPDTTSDKKNTVKEEDGEGDFDDGGSDISNSYMHLLPNTMTKTTADIACCKNAQGLDHASDDKLEEEEQYSSLIQATRGK